MQIPLVREVCSYVRPHNQFHILAVHYIFSTDNFGLYFRTKYIQHMHYVYFSWLVACWIILARNWLFCSLETVIAIFIISTFISYYIDVQHRLKIRNCL